MKFEWTIPLVLAAGASGCHGSPAAAEGASPRQPPPGEVWLTPAQVAEAKIETAPVSMQNVDDTLLTSGTVTLDDLKTGHVFSPVTGRVVSIKANPGDRVKRGDTLAVIDSPDISSAGSDVRKAQADLIAAEHDWKRKKDLLGLGVLLPPTSRSPRIPIARRERSTSARG